MQNKKCVNMLVEFDRTTSHALVLHMCYTTNRIGYIEWFPFKIQDTYYCPYCGNEANYPSKDIEYIKRLKNAE